MLDLDLAELDRLHEKASTLSSGFYVTTRTLEMGQFQKAITDAYPSLRARIAELERKEKAFDAIADRKATIRDKRSGGWEVVFQFDPSLYLNDDLLTAISAAVAAKESKHEAD